MGGALMKQYIKTALETLEALGCQLDHKDRELRTDRWIFTHPNTPDETYKLNMRSSETAARVVVQRAKVAAGLATSETGGKRKPKINERERRERAAEAQRREAARRLAAARRAEDQARRDADAVHRRRAELTNLLTGKSDSRVTPGAVDPAALLTIEQVADMTGLTDKAVQRAVATGALEAYQCGKVVKVKGADVRRWLTP